MPANVLGENQIDIQKKFLEAIRAGDSEQANLLLNSALEQGIERVHQEAAEKA